MEKWWFAPDMCDKESDKNPIFAERACIYTSFYDIIIQELIKNSTTACAVLPMQYTPSRGRKLACFLKHNFLDLQCNTPPHGDENRSRHCLRRLAAMQYTPSRGRKPSPMSSSILLIECNTPPHGDEIFPRKLQKQLYHTNQTTKKYPCPYPMVKDKLLYAKIFKSRFLRILCLYQ